MVIVESREPCWCQVDIVEDLLKALGVIKRLHRELFEYAVRKIICGNAILEARTPVQEQL